MTKKMQDLEDYLLNALNHNSRVAIRTDVNDKYEEIEILPAKQAAGTDYAHIRLIKRQDYDLTVDLGRANHFDIPDAFGDHGKRYILDIIKACIEGKLRETVTEKNGKAVKSRIEILLPSGKTSFNYSDGLLRFGSKKVIRYLPYPE